MSQTESKTPYNRPLRGDEKKRAIKTHITLITLGTVFMVASYLLVYFDAIRLYPAGYSVNSLDKFAHRIEFTLRYQTLLVAWLVFNIVATIYGRITRKAFNPLYEETEEQVTFYKNILTNSLEQVTISVLAQLVFVAFASPSAVLKYIPLVNIIQLVGRITFFVGYPMKRGFGFHCSLLPNMVIVIFDVIYFLKFVF